jgi:PAS domain S-box-containing protein
MAVIVEVLSRRDVESFLAGGGDASLRDAVADFLRDTLDELYEPTAVSLATVNGVGMADFQRARELLEALPAAIYTTDRAGRITYYNQAAVELWGRRPELGDDQWCGSWRLYWPDGMPMAHDECPMAVALRGERPVRNAEAVAERPDGTRVPFIPYPTLLRDAAGAVVGAVNMLVDITERKAAETALRDREARLALLAREVDHRARNILTTVLAITRWTQAESVPAFVEALTGRIHALSRAHTLLAEGEMVRVDLKRLVEQELAAYGGDEGRVKIAGFRFVLGPETAQPLAMVLHELATNAAKYGALSVAGGHVAIEWSWTSDRRLVLRWTESGGPTARKPSREGFGSELIELLTRQLGGVTKLDWRAQGLVCEFSIPASTLEPIRAAAQ